MKIGQYVSLKDSANYTEVFDTPDIGAKSESFTAGYLGQITALDIYEVVAGSPEDAHIYTKILNKNNEVKYLDNKDIRLYDYSDTAPTGGTVSKPPTMGNNSGSTLDKIVGVFTGLLGLFNKTKTTTTDTKSDPNKTKTVEDTKKESNTPNTNTQKTFAQWFAANWWWAIVAIIIIPGGIIWAIVAASKADKKKALQMSSATPPKV